MVVAPIVMVEQLGVHYERTLVPVPPVVAGAYTDQVSGRVYPVQALPSLPTDATSEPMVHAIVADLAPFQRLELVPTPCPALPAPITIRAGPEGAEIANGELAVRVPADGWYQFPVPGPLGAWRLGTGAWRGRSTIAPLAMPVAVNTVVESIGPVAVQWRSTYRWGRDAGSTWHVRWLSGADTLQVWEEPGDGAGATWDWWPLGDAPTRAYVRGGGEGRGPMEELTVTPPPGALPTPGLQLLGRLSHISYFNQWNYSWVGFAAAADEGFAGVYAASGGAWQARGHLRIQILEDRPHGCFLRFPLAPGRRCYGIVLSTRAASGLDDPARRCLLNRRKTQLADLAWAKVATWELAPPADEPRRPHLYPADAVAQARNRLARDPTLVAALARFCGQAPADHPGRFAAAVWAGDRDTAQRALARLVAWATNTLADVADGGYERLIIFDGRAAKRLAYDADAAWALGWLTPEDYRTIRRTFLALAYMFSDPDYCRYEDFWPHLAPPSEGIAEALRDDMGDCPVPPNFASEFSTTVGVMAELFPAHPQAAEWRRWSVATLGAFLDKFFAPDGTYAESINYHSHAFNEILCQVCPQRQNGTYDFLRDPRIRGCFRHFVAIQMPRLTQGVPPLDVSFADAPATACAPMPANGNSGGEGQEQLYRGELALGAALLQQDDPELAGWLMAAWRAAGRPLLDGEHPLLSLLALDPAIPAQDPPWRSTVRNGLGLVSKATQPGGARAWALFRAGRATHHEDFDQGNLHLALGDRVLLGDYGYQASDNAGRSLAACATWLHNTLVYSDNKEMTSGYTGLEEAPVPVALETSPDYDWGVVLIENRNYRRLDCLRYMVQLPGPVTKHVRHYLFVKPDYVVLWDVFLEGPNPSLFFLHPREPLKAQGPGRFRAGVPGQPHLDVQFVVPGEPQVVENEQVGALWSFAARQPPGEGWLVLLAPSIAERELTATWEPAQRLLTVSGAGLHDAVQFPPPGTNARPAVTRRGR